MAEMVDLDGKRDLLIMREVNTDYSLSSTYSGHIVETNSKEVSMTVLTLVVLRILHVRNTPESSSCPR